MKTLQKLKEKNINISDQFYVFDTETNGLRAQSDAFIFGVLYGENTLEVFYSVKEFKEEFKKPKYKKKKIFAHNAEYDLGVIYDNIYNIDKEAVFNGKFICCTNGNCMFADSMNIFSTSVKKIGEMLGLKKLEIDQEYIKGNIKGKKGVTKQMINYCIRDCEIVYEALYYIFNYVGNVKITIASLTLDLFRRQYQPFHIDFNEQLVKYFFESYYGGRCEAFFIGKTNAKVYDFNSMYPDAMLNCLFPNPKFLQYNENCSEAQFKDYYLKYFEGVAKVELFHVEHFFGFLPVKKEGKLLFPVGNITGYFNFNELRFALENKIIKIKKVHKVIFAPAMESPFKDYINTLYKKRKESNSVLEKNVLKLFMNSLYGKFAQKIKSEMIYIDDMVKQYEIINQYVLKKKLIRIIPFNAIRKDCFIEIKSKHYFLYNTIPSFSSYITSYARIKLLSEMLKYKSHNIVYCDTDSIFCEKELPLKNSDELGQLKLENKIVTEIAGLKNYRYLDENKNENQKIKGIPKGAQKIDERTYIFKSLMKTKEATRRNLTSGIETERKKILSLKYEKRIVANNGTTKPIKL
jgi:hypothetical protein